ncbi:hemerythrin [Betaproteobacteria bacterium]|nr:hemerythrin [Betaproteobacteria bacterium]GHU02234.1 hemerythrin [Betaproteobacteria bacterium]GHU06340.1 hemerythrin [Betaproteobacteria bacterium]GHU24096.1 hemerythrin [Betaproteobacteria bacterium]
MRKEDPAGWSDDYSVGIPEIDEQHKTLFELVNKIHDAISAHQGSAASREVMDQLVEYTRVHFALEQNLMHTGNFPGYKEHCVLHTNLIDEVVSMQEKINSGKVAISFELLHFLRNWLSKHILVEDKQYARYFNTHGHDQFSNWARRSDEAMKKQRKKWWKFW